MSALGPREHAEIRRFRAALTLDPGVSFHVVVADTRRVLDEALAEIGVEVELVRPLALASVDAEEHAEGILQRFGAAIERAGGRPVVLEAIVSTPATDRAWKRVFAALNEARNSLEQRASGPVVLCVCPWLEQALGHEAPDVWSKRGSGMRLVDRTPNWVFISHASDSPDVEAHVDELAAALTDAGLSVDRARWPAVDLAEDLEPLAEERVGRADVVVCVCTPLYRARVSGEEPPGSDSGATWEARAVRRDAYQLGPMHDRFLLVGLPIAEVGAPSPLGARRAIHRWPEDRARVIEAASAPPVHVRLFRGIERAFGDDAGAMERWAADFITLRTSESDHTSRTREVTDCLLRVRDLDVSRRVLASLGELQGDRAVVGSIATTLGLGELPWTMWRSAAPASPSPLSPAELEDYLDVIVSHHRADPSVTSCDDLYYPVRGSVLMPVAETTFDVRVSTLPLVFAFQYARELGRRALVLRGGPGSGKSTRLAQLLLKVARDGAETIGLPKGTVPLLLPLRNLRPETKDPWDFVMQQVDSRWPSAAAGIGARLREHGRLLLLLDDFDGIAESAQRSRVSRWIESMRRSAPDTYVLVTERSESRSLELVDDVAIIELSIRSLTAAQTRHFVTRWCSEAGIDQREVGHILAELSQWRLEAPDLAALEHDPQGLSALCEVCVEDGWLPRSAWQLYEACVRLRLRRHRFRAVTHAALEDVAWWMLTEKLRGRATAASLEPVLRRSLSGLEPHAWLRSIRKEHGLLIEWGLDLYGFTLPGIGDFLASERIRALLRRDPGALARHARQFGAWRKTVMALLWEADPVAAEKVVQLMADANDSPAGP